MKHAEKLINECRKFARINKNYTKSKLNDKKYDEQFSKTEKVAHEYIKNVLKLKNNYDSEIFPQEAEAEAQQLFYPSQVCRTQERPKQDADV